jgi:hypothetical protein
MRRTTSRTKSRSFTLIELVPLPQLLNLTARKTGAQGEVSPRKSTATSASRSSAV